MKHVICRLPNASHLINGIAFRDHDDEPGVVVTVDPVDDAVAEHFASIKGYEALDVDADAADQNEQAAEDSGDAASSPAAEKPKGKGGRKSNAQKAAEAEAAKAAGAAAE